MDHIPKCKKSKITKYLKDNIGKISSPQVQKTYLDVAPKAQSVTENVDNLIILKIKILFY